MILQGACPRGWRGQARPATLQERHDRHAHADAMVTTTRAAMEPVILGQKTLADTIGGGGMAVSGNTQSLAGLWTLMVDFKSGIALVEPR